MSEPTKTIIFDVSFSYLFVAVLVVCCAVFGRGCNPAERHLTPYEQYLEAAHGYEVKVVK